MSNCTIPDCASCAITGDRPITLSVFDAEKVGETEVRSWLLTRRQRAVGLALAWLSVNGGLLVLALVAALVFAVTILTGGR